jgi:hypothetical protein
MITYFYKILDKNKNVIYVGVTTRTVKARFQEHKNKKSLADDCTCIIIDSIIHPEIKDLETFSEERKKVADLEQKYIKEEKLKGSNLINISEGGEWGAHVLSQIQKQEFFKKYGTYNGYIEYRRHTNIIKAWLNHWIQCRTLSKTKIWLNNWVTHKKISMTKNWLSNWVINKSKNKTSVWLRDWIRHTSENKTKSWLYSWMINKNKNRTKIWLQHWISHSIESKTKSWLCHWINHRSTNKTKEWLKCWITNTTYSKTKLWLRNWVNHKTNKGK